MTIKDLTSFDFEKRIKITSATNKALIGKMGTLTNAFAGEKVKIGLFLDIPLKNGNDEINLTGDINFEFTTLMF
jgi:hypothetical protein